MSWRSLMISNPARLSRDNRCLRIEQEETVTVPFEDIAVIVLDHKQITLTHPVLSTCAQYGIALFSTGENHQPNGLFCPFEQHSKAVKILRMQMSLRKPLQKNLWSQLVRSKILNQSRCLHFLSLENEANKLLLFSSRVRSGDPDNIEALAASLFFKTLYGSTFSRKNQNFINAQLNYGYAILRGAVTRVLVAHGLFPPLGLFHHSEQNSFNLADDIIEPFRPVVDLYVASSTSIIEEEVTPKIKANLIRLLNVDMVVAQETTSVMNAIEMCVESLVRCLSGNTEVLSLPILISLHPHQNVY